MQTTPTRPSPAPSTATNAPADVFDRSRFFLRQKHFSLQERYFVWTADEQKLAFVERPRHHARSLVALLGAVGALAVGGLVGFVVVKLALSPFIPAESAEAVAGLSAMLFGVAAAFAAGV